MKTTILAKSEWHLGEPTVKLRRATELERAALTVAMNVLPVGRDPRGTPPLAEIPVVFASRWGEIGTTIKLMRQMFEELEMSPAGFSASVHNAAPGALSLMTKNHAPYTAIAAGPDSYEMGLLEAKMTPGKVLFVYAEESTPEMYLPHFPAPEKAHAVALLLDNQP